MGSFPPTSHPSGTFFLFPFNNLCLILYREKVRQAEIPADLLPTVAEKRRELIEAVAEVDDVLAERFLNDEEITGPELSVCLLEPGSCCP